VLTAVLTAVLTVVLKTAVLTVLVKTEVQMQVLIRSFLMMMLELRAARLEKVLLNDQENLILASILFHAHRFD
jgi:hypothetical protein